jgi:hypothetical protein
MPDEPSVGRRAGVGLQPAERAGVPLLNGKVVDLTGPGLTDRWGVTCTDLGASVAAPSGKDRSRYSSWGLRRRTLGVA